MADEQLFRKLETAYQQYRRGERDVALQWFLTARTDLLTEFGAETDWPVPAVLRACERMSALLAALEDWPTAADQTARGRHLARAANQATDFVLFSTNLGIALQQLGHESRAARVLGEAAEAALAIGNLGLRAKSLAHMGAIMRDIDPIMATDHFHRSVEAYRIAGDRQGEARSLGGLATAFTDLGNRDKSRYYIERSRQLFREIGDLEGEARAVGQLASEQDRLDEVVSLLDEATGLFRRAKNPVRAATTALEAAEIVAQHDTPDALARAATAGELAGDFSVELAERIRTFQLTLSLELSFRALDEATTDDARDSVLAAHPELMTDSALLTAAGRLAENQAALTRLAMRPDSPLPHWIEAFWNKLLTLDAKAPARLNPAIRPLLGDLFLSETVELLDRILSLVPEAELPGNHGFFLMRRAFVRSSSDQQEAIGLGTHAANLLYLAGANEEAADAHASVGTWWRTLTDGDRRHNAEQAVASFEHVLPFYRRQEHPVKWATNVMNLANAYWSHPDKGINLIRAEEHLRAALEVLNPHNHPDEYGHAILNLGLVLTEPMMSARTEADSGIKLLNRALRSLGDPRVRAAALHNLSLAYAARVIGDPDVNLELARRHAQDAQEFYRVDGSSWERLGAADLVATIELRIADRNGDTNVDHIVERFSAALSETTPEEAPLTHAAALDNLASALSLGTPSSPRLRRAVSLHETALHVFDVHGDTGGGARARFNLAGCLGKLTLLTESQAFGGENPAGDRSDVVRDLGPSPVDTVEMLLVVPPSRTLDRIIHLYGESLAGRPRKNDPFEWMESAIALSRALLARGSEPDFEQALRLLQDAAEVATIESAPGEVQEVGTLLGNAYGRRNEWHLAAHEYRSATAAAEALYMAPALGASRERELNRIGWLFSEAAYALAKAGEPGEAAALIETSLARELSRLLDRDHLDLGTLEQDAPSLAEAYHEAADDLARVESAQRTVTSLDPEGRRMLHAMLADAQSRLRAVTTTIQEHFGNEQFGLQTDDIVSRAARDHTPLIHLVTTALGSVALVTEPSGTSAVFTPLTTWDLVALRLSHERHEEIALTVIGENLLQPIAETLIRRGLSRVILVPTGALGGLPLHAARYVRGSSIRHVLDELTVSYAQSARALVAARSMPTSDADPCLVGVVDPQPGARLPGATAEASAVRRIFPGTVRMLGGEAASNAALIAELPGATHLHFACHAGYNVREPLRSGIQLAGDDRLTLAELFDGTRLKGIQLVVAAACETAVTDPDRTLDEAMGLPSGFLYAGAATVLGTLWKVNDESASYLISRFYANHFGEDRAPLAQALADAQRWLRDSSVGELRRFAEQVGLPPVGGDPDDPSPFAGPVHWAAFVIIGSA